QRLLRLGSRRPALRGDPAARARRVHSGARLASPDPWRRRARARADAVGVDRTTRHAWAAPGRLGSIRARRARMEPSRPGEASACRVVVATPPTPPPAPG